MLPILDLDTAAGQVRLKRLLAKLRATANTGSDAGQIVARIIDDVRRQGDRALVRYMRKWTDPSFSAEHIRVTPRELAAATRRIDPVMRRTIQAAIDHVRKYQEHVKPRDPRPISIDGARLGLRFTPVESAGLLVPGGRAPLFSTLIMLAVPALAAGVPAEAISVVHPPPTRRKGEQIADISPLVLATCALLGIDRVYRIGGAQAVAALAFGTQSVERVDLIAGPGNVYVQLAKQQVAGVVGSDYGFYGPSEIVTIADSNADPRCVAADLLAQAEHEPGKCFLIAWSRRVIERILAEVMKQRAGRMRLGVIDAALRDESAAILVRNETQAAQIAEAIAAEHVNLAVKDPQSWLARLCHGGEFFLGDQTPVAAGDYYAGPSHCLPTGTTARFASGVSVYTFLKRSGTVCYPRGMSANTIESIARLAQAEGLDAHAESARVRGDAGRSNPNDRLLRSPRRRRS